MSRASPLAASYRCIDCGSPEYRIKRFSRGWLVQCGNCRGWFFIEVAEKQNDIK
jgi:hypothetical protein